MLNSPSQHFSLLNWQWSVSSYIFCCHAGLQQTVWNFEAKFLFLVLFTPSREHLLFSLLLVWVDLLIYFLWVVLSLLFEANLLSQSFLFRLNCMHIFCCFQIDYMVFLALFSYVILVRQDKTPSVSETVLIIFVFTLCTEEIRQVTDGKLNRITHIVSNACILYYIIIIIIIIIIVIIIVIILLSLSLPFSLLLFIFIIIMEDFIAKVSSWMKYSCGPRQLSYLGIKNYKG